MLDETLQPAPFIHDPLAETSGNTRKTLKNGNKPTADIRTRRRGTPDSLNEILGIDIGEDDDLVLDDDDVVGDGDFVVDDDGAGYALGLNGNGKRTNGHLGPINGIDAKRRAGYQTWQPILHLSFQPGSTPWRGSRRYLCMLLGLLLCLILM